jgi:hypothetical protein
MPLHDLNSPTMDSMISAEGDPYPNLLAANAAAFEAGHYETAYHSLMAALHSADDRRDHRRLEEVASLAMAQQASIDSVLPGHRLSSGSASLHGHKGVFEIAASQARTRALMVRRQLSEHRG